MVDNKIIFEYKEIKTGYSDFFLNVLYFLFFLLLIILIGICDKNANKGELLVVIFGEIVLWYIIHLSRKEAQESIKSCIEINAQFLYILSSMHNISVRKKWEDIEKINVKTRLIDTFSFFPYSSLIIKFKGSEQTLLNRIFYGEGDIVLCTSNFTLPIRESNLDLLLNTLLKATDIAEREAVIKSYPELKEAADF